MDQRHRATRQLIPAPAWNTSTKTTIATNTTSAINRGFRDPTTGLSAGDVSSTSSRTGLALPVSRRSYRRVPQVGQGSSSTGRSQTQQ